MCEPSVLRAGGILRPGHGDHGHRDLDMFTADRLEPALAAIPPGTPTWIDLTDCDYVDSAGLHVLRTYTREIGPEHVTLVAPENTPVRRVLELTGLATAYYCPDRQAPDGIHR